MNEIEFNLIDEPWIPVLDAEDAVREISLKEALLYGQNYQGLAGELPPQNVAILRFLLAMLYTIFFRVDTEGRSAAIESVGDALNRWRSLQENGAFPEKPVFDYLEQWHERFWLFHPTHPFYQVRAAKEGTTYEAAKLNGAISESGNKQRIFSGRAGEGKTSLSYAESARWLLFINGYDDTSAKPTPKTGWLGKCGMIYALGKNLYETLLLNLTFLRDGIDVWPAACPAWELDAPVIEPRREVVIPDNPASLYTLQSRRILLRRENGRVTGCTLQGGDYFEEKDALAEQMTVWKRPKPKKGELPYVVPRRCTDVSRQMWRDFANDFVGPEDMLNRRPGIVSWIERLRREKCIEKRKMIFFRTVSVLYSRSGIPDSALEDVSSDSITFHTELLTELGRPWQKAVVEEVANCDKLAGCVGELARNLNLACGVKESRNEERAKAILYDSIDGPFRTWLAAADPEDDTCDLDEHRTAWHETARNIGRTLGRQMVETAPPSAFKGRVISIKKGAKKKDVFYASPLALNWFYGSVNKLYPKEEEK
jgi:CRISPR system Cascade subunit CasA